MQNARDKARVLIEALPYINEFRGTTLVVKIGGAALEDLALRERFAEDIILLSWVGIRVVVVHGDEESPAVELTGDGMAFLPMWAISVKAFTLPTSEAEAIGSAPEDERAYLEARGIRSSIAVPTRRHRPA